MSLGTYSFIPWVRLGIANRVQPPAAGAHRTEVAVRLTLSGTGGDTDLTAPVERDVELFGPGDVVGIDSKAIIKVEPQPWITSFEPNYLPYVDFYDEDFPWRYTPAPPAGHRLTPWISLAVLTEDEFANATDVAGRPLPMIQIADPDNVLPPPENLWAWAHVHVNRRVSDPVAGDPVNAGSVLSTSASAVASRLSGVLAENPDLAYARVLSPRKLTPDTGYHAFLIPAFESGRLAGLGLDPTATPEALFPSFGRPYPAGVKPKGGLFPIYYRWFFRTGARGDFEYLVRLLEPRMADSRIGRRDVDVMRPGTNLPPIDDAALRGVLRLGGALQVPVDTLPPDELTAHQTYDQWASPYPHPFQVDLSRLVNLRDDYAQAADATAAHADSGLTIEHEGVVDQDPVITPPIYGRWHARVERLLDERDGSPVANRENWLHDLNLDPRYRMAAGFGTEVVQVNQEDYMAAAWRQVGDVLAANRRLRLSQHAHVATAVWHTAHLAPTVEAAAGHGLQLMAPVAARVLVDGAAARHTLDQSVVPPALVTAPFRRASRPRGRTLKRLTRDHELPADDIVTRVSRGEVEPVPPKQDPSDVLTPTEVGDAVTPDPGGEPGARRLLRWVLLVLLVVLGIAALLLLSPVVALVALVVLVVVGFAAWRATEPVEPPRIVGAGEEPVTPADIDALPSSPDFRIITLGDPFRPTLVDRPGQDSAEGRRLKVAVAQMNAMVSASLEVSAVADPVPIDIAAFTGAVLAAVEPRATFTARLAGTVLLPARIVADLVETFAPIKAYPVIDLPMYEPLVDLSDEHFVPGLQYVGQNTISLLETNQPFIEAYMVGVNHEMNRELMWREFPTELRGTPCRQFWDASGVLDVDGRDPETLREELRDIPPIHLWPRASDLGDHDHRDRGGEAENELVLVIRGELLKRYPNAVIYAQRARWQRAESGEILQFEERRLVDLTPAEEEEPPPDKLKTPLYEAKVDPDIYFFGFDLTALDARGGTGEDDDDPGWFFVIKERPGEPRFGLDVDSAGGGLANWSDLAWPDALPGPGDHQFLSPVQSFSLNEPADTDERHPQWAEDQHVPWTPATNAANLAYILYQVPVMVAVHAAEMLPKEG